MLWKKSKQGKIESDWECYFSQDGVVTLGGGAVCREPQGIFPRP